MLMVVVDCGPDEAAMPGTGKQDDDEFAFGMEG
jgi:hypothetical protein